MVYQIYCITNKLNNKSYVGQSIDAKERWKDHIHDAKRMIGKTANTKKFAIHNAIAKYGEEAFVWQIIEEHDNLDQANEAEEFFISYLDTLAPNGYNLQTGGKNKRPSQITKDKISVKLKIVGSFVGKSGADHPNFGTKQTDERKRQQSLRSSGDGSNGKKITSQIAKQIYTEYLIDTNISSAKLAVKYGIKKSAVCNILHKRSWKNTLKDLPEIDFSQWVSRRK